MLQCYLLALLVVAVAVALLLVAGGALLLVLPVHQGLVHLQADGQSVTRGQGGHHLALFLVDRPAALLARGVEHRAAAGDGELVTVLLVADTLGDRTHG